MDPKKIAVGAVSGLVSAVLVDLHAWSGSTGGFDWKKAATRWIGGAISGAASAAGVSTVVG